MLGRLVTKDLVLVLELGTFKIVVMEFRFRLGSRPTGLHLL